MLRHAAVVQEFMRRVTAVNPNFARFKESSLSDLVAVLNRPNANPDDVHFEMLRIVPGIKEKYIGAYRYLAFSYPGLKSYLGDELAALRKLVLDGASVPALQTALDAVPIDVARKYHDGLQFLVNLRPELYYFAIDGCQAYYSGRPFAQMDSRLSRFNYSSVRFNANVGTYSIFPTGQTVDVGFVAATNADEISFRFGDRRQELRQELPGGATRNDAEAGASFPFVPPECNGMEVGGLQFGPSSRVRQPLDGDQSFGYSQEVGETHNSQQMAGAVTSFRHRRSSAVLFVLRRPNQQTYQVYRVIEWGFELEFPVVWNDNARGTQLPVSGRSAPIVVRPMPKSTPMNPALLNRNVPLVQRMLRMAAPAPQNQPRTASPMRV